MFKTLAFAAAMLAMPLHAAVPATTASAPATPAAALTPNQQQARLRKQDAKLTAAALQVALLIDTGKAGEVWDGAAKTMQHAVERTAFIAAVDADRAKLGAVTKRTLLAISRTHSNGRKTPPGDYVNINFASRFADTPQPVRELVSFHLDADQVWRVSGYSLR